jgi:hypothetical protein
LPSLWFAVVKLVSSTSGNIIVLKTDLQKIRKE